MKIGLSLSFCVQDIIEGKMDINDVAFIYSGTKAKTKEQWDDVLTHYADCYWQYNKMMGMTIARRLLNDGMIIQPRLEGKYLFKGKLNWLDEHEFNKYCKENLHYE